MLPAVRQIPENLCGHSRRRPDCIYAKVEVTIQNGEITGIRILEHKNERGQAAEAVVDRIVAEQRILRNYPIYCPKCKKETIIDAQNLQITVIKEPDA